MYTRYAFWQVARHGDLHDKERKGKTEISLQLTDLIRLDWEGWVPEWIDTDKRLRPPAGYESRHFFAMIGEFKKKTIKTSQQRPRFQDNQLTELTLSIMTLAIYFMRKSLLLV